MAPFATITKITKQRKANKWVKVITWEPTE